MNEDHHPVGRPSGESGAMTIDRAELRKKAEEATPGPWVFSRNPHRPVGGPSFEVGAPDRGIAGQIHSHDAAYIVAAQPSTVLALLDRIEELEAAVAPFGEYAKGSTFDQLPDEFPISSGSPFARRQVTAGDFRRARKALSGEKP